MLGVETKCCLTSRFQKSKQFSIEILCKGSPMFAIMNSIRDCFSIFARSSKDRYRLRVASMSPLSSHISFMGIWVTIRFEKSIFLSRNAAMAGCSTEQNQPCFLPCPVFDYFPYSSNDSSIPKWILYVTYLYIWRTLFSKSSLSSIASIDGQSSTPI